MNPRSLMWAPIPVSEGQQDGRSPMIWALPDPRFTKEAKDERS